MPFRSILNTLLAYNTHYGCLVRQRASYNSHAKSSSCYYYTQFASRPLKFTTLGIVFPPSNMKLLGDCKIWKETHECILQSDWELGQDDKPFHFDKPTITFRPELCQWLNPSLHTITFPSWHFCKDSKHWLNQWLGLYHKCIYTVLLFPTQWTEYH